MTPPPENTPTVNQYMTPEPEPRTGYHSLTPGREVPTRTQQTALFIRVTPTPGDRSNRMTAWRRDGDPANPIVWMDMTPEPEELPVFIQVPHPADDHRIGWTAWRRDGNPANPIVWMQMTPPPSPRLDSA